MAVRWKLHLSQLPNQHRTIWAVTSTAEWTDWFWECEYWSGKYKWSALRLVLAWHASSLWWFAQDMKERCILFYIGNIAELLWAKAGPLSCLHSTAVMNQNACRPPYPSDTSNFIPWRSQLSRPYYTGLHTQKAYTHTSTSSPQIPMLSAHAYMHFAWELQLDSQCVHHTDLIAIKMHTCMNR